MPNNPNLSHQAHDAYEIITENTRIIDSLTTLVIGAQQIFDDPAMIADAMLLIDRLTKESQQANEQLYGITKAYAGGSHD